MKADERKFFESTDDVFRNTPLEFSERISDLLDSSIYLKREDLQVTGSYKIRGVYNKINSLGEVDKYMGVVCAAGDDLATAAAYCCKLLGVKGTIYMPKESTKQDLISIQELGGNVITIRHTDLSYEGCLAKASSYAMSTGRTLIHPFSDQKVMQGEIRLVEEILGTMPGTSCIVIPVGRGSMANSAWLRTKFPLVEFYLVESLSLPVLRQVTSGKQGKNIACVVNKKDAEVLSVIREREIEVV